MAGMYSRPTLMLATTTPTWNGITAQAISATVKVMIGAIRKRARLAADGLMVSCRNTLAPSATDWSRPKGTTSFGPRRRASAAQILQHGRATWRDRVGP